MYKRQVILCALLAAQGVYAVVPDISRFSILARLTIPIQNEFMTLNEKIPLQYLSLIHILAKVVFDLILDVKDAWKDINDFIYGYQSICPINAFEKQEFLNIYAYTLSKDFSGIDGKPNKNVFYLERRISKHKNVLECFDEYDEIVKRLNW